MVGTEDRIVFPQFIEMLARVSMLVHQHRVEAQRSRTRSALESHKLDFTLLKLLEDMDMQKKEKSEVQEPDSPTKPTAVKGQ